MPEQLRLLVVDDEAVHRAFASVVLSAVGWTVDEAPDGAAALRAIAARRYAVVLLDIGMPGADGFAIARAIRAGHAGDPMVPILAFTARTGADLGAHVAAAGMDGHIAKPIPAADLIARVAPFGTAVSNPAHARLVAAFGADEVAALNAGFRVQLGDALTAIAGPDIRAVAHRIAGLAGTLGFADVHRTWLALSEGEAGAAAAAASAARRMLRALAAADPGDG